MTTNPVCLRLAPDSLLHSLQSEALAAVQAAESELVLDFCAIPRIGAGAVVALEELARIAGQGAVRILLRNVNINVYKTLTLLKVVHRFTYVA